MRKENEDMELLCMIGCFLNLFFKVVEKMLDGFIMGIAYIFESLK